MHVQLCAAALQMACADLCPQRLLDKRHPAPFCDPRRRSVSGPSVQPGGGRARLLKTVTPSGPRAVHCSAHTTKHHGTQHEHSTSTAGRRGNKQRQNTPRPSARSRITASRPDRQPALRSGPSAAAGSAATASPANAAAAAPAPEPKGRAQPTGACAGGECAVATGAFSTRVLTPPESESIGETRFVSGAGWCQGAAIENGHSTRAEGRGS